MLYNFYLTHFSIRAIIKKKFDGRLGALTQIFSCMHMLAGNSNYNLNPPSYYKMICSPPIRNDGHIRGVANLINNQINYRIFLIP